MEIAGQNLIGAASINGSNGTLWGIEAASGKPLPPEFGGASQADLERTCALAHTAFATYRNTPGEIRARLLEAIADNLLGLGDTLVDRCAQETGLPRARIEGERARTIGQLRLFASVAREGSCLGVRIDPALPERTPVARPDIRLRHIALGPVAVFGASNFPLAFSVAGGDTASALAAGCPVVVKAHGAHPGTSELVGRVIQQAVKHLGLPEGVFSLLFDSGRSIGQGLVADRRIKAVGFTGSRSGGTALMNIAAARPEPIPVYAEMSSINPVILMPGALQARAGSIGQAFVSSLTLGAGQFCTNPGLVVLIEGVGVEDFIASAAEALGQSEAQTMLTPGIHRSYCEGVTALAGHPGVSTVATGRQGQAHQGQATLLETTGEQFLAHEALRDEIFGAASLIVRCRDLQMLHAVIGSLEGQLTASVHLAESDKPAARELISMLELKVGRILLNGFGTGVEVCHAMVHGGPFPSTSDTRTTSVGSLAIERFLRPVSYQDFPQDLLAAELRDDHAGAVLRYVNGRFEL